MHTAEVIVNAIIWDCTIEQGLFHQSNTNNKFLNIDPGT